MSGQILRRGLFTDNLLAYVATNFAATPILLGDGEAPGTAGWVGQQPGVGAFLPYVILSTGPANHNFTESLRGKDTSWRLTYGLRGVGANRQQADYACDVARPIMSNLQHFTTPVGVANRVYKVTKSEYSSLGSLNRNDNTDPPLWDCVDSLEIWLDLGP